MPMTTRKKTNFQFFSTVMMPSSAWLNVFFCTAWPSFLPSETYSRFAVDEQDDQQADDGEGEGHREKRWPGCPVRFGCARNRQTPRPLIEPMLMTM